MNESEIVLKITELILKSKTSDLWGDLIKVGIPSLVALASTCSTIYMGIRTVRIQKEHDEKIAELNNAHDVLKLVSVKKDKLIDSIASGISEIYDSAEEYTTLFEAKKFAEKDGTSSETVDLLEKKTTDAYWALTEIKRSHIYKLKAKVLLLNNAGVEKEYDKFVIKALEILTECPIHTTLSDKEISERNNIKTPFHNLSRLLSKEYLSV